MSKEVGVPESDRLEGAPHPRERLEFFGHAAAEQALLCAYRQNRMAQAWILGGPEGIGKATLAWRLARFLLAHPDPLSPDVQQARSLFVPADSSAARHIASMALADIFLLRRSWNDKTKKFYTEIRIDDVREIIHALHRGSGTGGWRVAIVDCADELNRSSANALLKLIEEPPDRALFLLIAHQPGRILPTIRSRCRRLMLEPMQPADIAKAVETLGPQWAESPRAMIGEAADQAHGSVREALRLLDGDGVAFDRTLRALFDRLPQVDWSAVHALADRLTGRDNEPAYDTFMRAVHRFLDTRVRVQAGEGAAKLIGYASAWEEIGQAARETEIFNFDKKALVLGIFERLEKAARR
jgi:DNA polymerase-3 subunit delta'